MMLSPQYTHASIPPAFTAILTVCYTCFFVVMGFDRHYRSPIYALFSETLDGAVTIRAFGRQVSPSRSGTPSSRHRSFVSFRTRVLLDIHVTRPE